MKNLSNKQLVDRINYRYENNLNDDDEIFELCRRRKEQNKQIAIINKKLCGEKFIIINK